MGNKIVNVYKPSPTKQQMSDIPVFIHLAFIWVTLTAHILVGIILPTIQTATVWPLGQQLITLSCFTTQRTLPASTQVVGTLEQTQAWHLSMFSSDSCLPDRLIVKKFFRSPSLIVLSKFALLMPSRPAC